MTVDSAQLVGAGTRQHKRGEDGQARDVVAVPRPGLAAPELAAADLAAQHVGDAEFLGERHRGFRRFADVTDLLPVEAAVALLKARAGVEEGADLDWVQ